VIAHLDSSIDDKKIKAKIDIKGIVQAEELSYYNVEYAYGIYPKNDSWILLANSTEPNEGVLATLDPKDLNEGQYTIRLQLKAGDYLYEDSAVIVVDNHPNTFYVDDDNIEGPWFGTQDHPFTHIQTAIDSCGVRSDKVEVNPGIYYEPVSIGNDKSVHVHGVDKSTTVIHGLKDQHFGLNMFRSRFNTFDGFTITNFYIGINLFYCGFNRLYDNIIIDNSEFGIALLYTLGNQLFDNTFINNTENVFGFSNLNLWYSPLRFRGNYWDDYKNFYPRASPRLIMSWCWNTPYTTMTYFRDMPIQFPSQIVRLFFNNDRFPLINPP
jgi:parallel beta-helix repeat protein